MVWNLHSKVKQVTPFKRQRSASSISQRKRKEVSNSSNIPPMKRVLTDTNSAMHQHKQTSVDGETEDDTMSSLSRQNTNTTVPSLTGVARLKKLTKTLTKPRIESSTISEKEVIPEVVLDKKYEPTYRMEPSQGKRFSPARAKVVIQAVLSTLLDKYEYSSGSPNPAEMTMKLPELIIKQVKTLDFERYKFVCLVSMGSAGDNSVCISSRCLWDTNLDTCVTYTHTDKTYYCTVTLYGFYHE